MFYHLELYAFLAQWHPPVPRPNGCSSGRANIGTFGRGASQNMYTVYVLRGKSGKLYKGMTNNLYRRLKEHKFGKTATTARMNGFELMYKEEYTTFGEARQRELYLKSAAGRRFLKKQIVARA